MSKPFVVQLSSRSIVGMIVALSLVQVNSQRLSRAGERENATPDSRAEGGTENETDSFVADELNEAVLLCGGDLF